MADDDEGTTIDTGGGDNTDQTGGDSDTTGGDDWTPPTRDEFEKMQRALAKANTEAKNWRTKHRQLETKGEDDTAKATREAAEATERKYKATAVRSAAKAAFLEAGLPSGSPDKLARVVRMLDLDELVVDDDGDVTGLDEQVAAIKKELPELFGTQDKRPPRLDTGNHHNTGRTKNLTSSQIQARQVLGR